MGEPADSARLRLVVDLGTVNEDALAIAPDTLEVNGTDSTYRGRQYVGLGELDTERSDIGIFNADVDDIGILADRPDEIFQIDQGPIADLPLCSRTLGETVPVFPWGDLSVRCTNGNGVLDTEDLEVVAAHEQGFDAQRLVGARDVRADRIHPGDAGECRETTPEIVQLGNGHADVGDADARQIPGEADEPIRLRK